MNIKGSEKILLAEDTQPVLEIYGQDKLKY